MQQQHAQQISEHMEVVGSDGGHVGTVDKVEEGRIKLTKKDDPDGSGAHHHYLSLDAVASVSGGQVRLSVPAEQAKQAAVGGAGGGGQAPGTGGLDRGMGAQVGVSGAGSMVSGNPGLGGGTGNPAMRDGVADLGAAAGPAGMSGDTAPGTIGGRPGGVGTTTGGRSTGGCRARSHRMGAARRGDLRAPAAACPLNTERAALSARSDAAGPAR